MLRGEEERRESRQLTATSDAVGLHARVMRAKHMLQDQSQDRMVVRQIHHHLTLFYSASALVTSWEHYQSSSWNGILIVRILDAKETTSRRQKGFEEPRVHCSLSGPEK